MQHLDRFSGGSGSLLWGLMLTFGQEYSMIACSLVLKAAANFLGPIGVNQLLHYLESDGEDAFVKPWVWVLALFLDPVLGTFGVSWYMYLTSMTLVRIEAMFTSLVFEHALRIRSTTTPDSDLPASSRATTPVSSTAVSVNEDETSREAKNLAGKINNLISSDLQNIGAGKEFMMLGRRSNRPLDLLLTLFQLFSHHS